MGSINEHLQHLTSYAFPNYIAFQQANPCTLIITNCFQIILMNILCHSPQFNINPQDQQPLKTCFYLELTLPQENVHLNVLAQRYGLQHQTILNFQPPLPLSGNLRNTSYTKKFPIMNFSNISPFQNKILCILVFCNSVYFWVNLLFRIFCVHIL